MLVLGALLATVPARGAEPSPEVRELMKRYERDAEAKKPKKPASRPAPKPASRPRPKPVVEPAAVDPPEQALSAPAPREPEMVRIPGGCFQMGRPPSELERSGDERWHEVCVKDFEIGQYEVTQGEWRAVMGANPSKFQKGDRYPVENVSWSDIQSYLQELNRRTGKNYRLPTEAEWEYAARARTTTPFWTGGCVTTGQANYDGSYDGYDQSDCGAKIGVYRGETMPVGSFKPNPRGLHDTMGNVLEWTCSKYAKDYDGSEGECAKKDTSSPLTLRGGSWRTRPAGVRSANRIWLVPTSRFVYAGFRLARSL